MSRSSSSVSSSRLFATVALAVAAGCTFSRDIQIKTHQLMRPFAPGAVNGYNVEEHLQRGYIPEVLEYLGEGGGLKSLDTAKGARVLGHALLERGDFRNAKVALARAFNEEGRPQQKADCGWAMAQALYWEGDFGQAAKWCRLTTDVGRTIPDGWTKFLEALDGKKLYAGVEPGASFVLPMKYGGPELIRVLPRINGIPAGELVVDSGASMSLLTESVAAKLGVVPIPGAVATAQGLHSIGIPISFGLAKTVTVGDITLENVPFGILQDDALQFNTKTAGAFHPAGVLGVHFMKEFDWKLDYPKRKVAVIRLDQTRTRGSRQQNLFFRRLKPMVRTSLQQEAWFLFLLDTGSEPTMLTRTGVRRSKNANFESSYPMTLEGIGQSRVSWGKMSNITVGTDRFQIWFKDIVVKEDQGAIEDGIIGSSFLSNFEVELRFSAMTVRLSQPVENYLREREERGQQTTSASPLQFPSSQ